MLAWAREHARSEQAIDLLITATAAASSRQLFTRDRAQASLARAVALAVELIG